MTGEANMAKHRISYTLYLGLDDSTMNVVLCSMLSVVQPVLLWRFGVIWFHGGTQMIVIRHEGMAEINFQCNCGYEIPQMAECSAK